MYLTIALASVISFATMIPASSAVRWRMFTLPKALIKPSASLPFTLTANNSDVFLNEPLNAQNTSFYIGNVTESFCPSTTKVCPPGNVTALRTSARGEALMVSRTKPGSSIQQIDIDALRRMWRFPEASRSMSI